MCVCIFVRHWCDVHLWPRRPKIIVIYQIPKWRNNIRFEISRQEPRPTSLFANTRSPHSPLAREYEPATLQRCMNKINRAVSPSFSLPTFRRNNKTSSRIFLSGWGRWFIGCGPRRDATKNYYSYTLTKQFSSFWNESNMTVFCFHFKLNPKLWYLHVYGFLYIFKYKT